MISVFFTNLLPPVWRTGTKTTLVILIASALLLSCKDQDEEEITPPKLISYHEDGRTVHAGDPLPLVVDLGEDGVPDFTVFLQLTANSQGDHLYGGINPIGDNRIKSTPQDDNHFLNMGFLIAEPVNTLISEELTGDQVWTTDHSSLVIRHTANEIPVWYEGAWDDEASKIVAIQWFHKDKFQFGWLRLRFSKAEETVTLVDFAYNLVADAPIVAGATQ